VSSSQRAQLILGALWFVATFTLVSVQLRVLAGDAPRVRRYVIGWIVASLVIGGLLGYLDKITGRAESVIQLRNVALAAIVGAAALAAGGALEAQMSGAGLVRFLRLVAVHGVVVASAYLFI
jgi:hypothetical protein